jgi:hypothetical protein
MRGFLRPEQQQKPGTPALQGLARVISGLLLIVRMSQRFTNCNRPHFRIETARPFGVELELDRAVARQQHSHWLTAAATANSKSSLVPTYAARMRA